jgi:hypothetical protein
VRIDNLGRTLGVGMSWMLPAVEACILSKGRIDDKYIGGIIKGYRAEGGPPAPPVAGANRTKPKDPHERAADKLAATILAYRTQKAGQ